MFLNQLRYLNLEYEVKKMCPPYNLSAYDLVVLVEPHLLFYKGESFVLHEFAEGGGNLLIFGDAWTPNHVESVYSEFGVEIIPDRSLKSERHLRPSEGIFQ